MSFVCFVFLFVCFFKKAHLSEGKTYYLFLKLNFDVMGNVRYYKIKYPTDL